MMPDATRARLERNVAIKAQLLAHGCSAAAGLEVGEATHRKKVHLYMHGTASAPVLPEDLILGDDATEVWARIRYEPTSPLALASDELGYLLRLADGERIRVRIPTRPGFWGHEEGGTPLSSLFSMLGQDLLGVVPSNYCHYFAHDLQCKFCEIVDSYKTGVEHPKATKRISAIVAALPAALERETSVRHLAVTSGNHSENDQTCRVYIAIATAFRNSRLQYRHGDTLATLMPPDDSGLIDELVAAGYNKLYFPLEIWDAQLFAELCPGKAAYGRDRMLAALDHALRVAGEGNVYTNFVYGLQSFGSGARTGTCDGSRENAAAMEATIDLLGRGVIPAFTVYHHAGFAPTGPITLAPTALFEFFREWGKVVHASQLIPPGQATVIFGTHSLTNTMYNEGLRLARA